MLKKPQRMWLDDKCVEGLVDDEWYDWIEE